MGRFECMQRTSSNNVIHNQNLLPRLDGALLELKVVRTVLLHILSRDTRTGQLALLAHSDEASIHFERQARAKQEAAGVEADDDIWGNGLVLGAKVLQLQLERAEQGSVHERVQEPWHDVEEVDAGDWEVGEAAEGALEAYLCTGEFGGGGGHGGGLASRGIVVCGGRQVALVRGGGCHCKEEEGKEEKKKERRKMRGSA